MNYQAFIYYCSILLVPTTIFGLLSIPANEKDKYYNLYQILFYCSIALIPFILFVSCLLAKCVKRKNKEPKPKLKFKPISKKIPQASTTPTQPHVDDQNDSSEFDDFSLDKLKYPSFATEEITRLKKKYNQDIIDYIKSRFDRGIPDFLMKSYKCCFQPIKNLTVNTNILEKTLSNLKHENALTNLKGVNYEVFLSFCLESSDLIPHDYFEKILRIMNSKKKDVEVDCSTRNLIKEHFHPQAINELDFLMGMSDRLKNWDSIIVPACVSYYCQNLFLYSDIEDVEVGFKKAEKAMSCFKNNRWLYLVDKHEEKRFFSLGLNPNSN